MSAATPQRKRPTPYRSLLSFLLAGCGLLPAQDQCASDEDCAASERCEASASLCVPAELCGNGLDDDEDGSADCEDLLECVDAPGCTTPGQVTTLDLGELRPGETGSFPVPEGTEGFTLVVEGKQENVIGLSSLIDPNGMPKVQGFQEGPLRQFNSQEAFGFLLPQGDNLQNQVLPGDWSFVLGASIAAPLRVKVHLRAGPVSGGALQLNIYLPEGLLACKDPACNDGEGELVDPENARSFAEMQGLLRTLFEEVLAPQTSLTQGEVRFFSVPERFLEISSMQELDQLFRESEKGAEGLHLFLVQGFSGGGFSLTTAGVSSGIPGAIQSKGNRNSGFAVKILRDADLSQNLTGLVAAHELGHFLGLWHTTEFSGDTDLLSDTPSCPTAMLSQITSCPDFGYVMFPMLSTSATKLSATQQKVLRAGIGY